MAPTPSPWSCYGTIEVIQTWACTGNACDFTLEDTAGSGACYYLRVTQKDEHMAWSSPHLGGPRLTPFPANEKRNGIAVPLFQFAEAAFRQGSGHYAIPVLRRRVRRRGDSGRRLGRAGGRRATLPPSLAAETR